MRAGHMRIMSSIAPEAAIRVLALFQPPNDFVNLFFWQLAVEGGKAGKGPVSTCDFEVLGEVLSDRVEVFAVL